jgi:hypothetical protein
MNANHPVLAGAKTAMACGCMIGCGFVILGLCGGCSSVVTRDSASVFDGTALVGAHQISITPSKTAGYPGEKVTARLTVRNTGTQPLWVPIPLSQCRLDLQFGPVDELVIDDPFFAAQFTCRELRPRAEVSIEREFVVPDTTSRCEFFTGYSSLRTNAVSFTVLQRSKSASAISVH